MANLTSTQEKLSMGSPSMMLRAAILNLTPMLLAAALSGCATKATHLGSLSGDPSLAGSESSTRRTSEPATAQTGRSATRSDGSSSPSAGAGAGGNETNPVNDGGPDGAGTSSASDGTGGKSTGARTAGGGNQASSSASGTGGLAAEEGGDGASSLAGGAEGADSAGATATPGGAAARGRAGANGARAGAASSSPGSANAGGEGGSSGGDAAAADLSAGGSVAAAEGGTGGASAGQGGRASGSSGADGAAAEGTAGAGAGGATASGMEGDERIAAIDVPSGKVKVDEEYRPQTLGGALPLILGVNEEGRFDFDQYSLRPEVKRVLDELAEKLKAAEYDRLDIIGYTDRIGTNDYNRRLSELRAYAVAQYLMGKGVPENKIHYEGRGDRNPLTPAGECQGLAREDLITCLQKDRRVEIEASIHRKHATVVQ